MTLINRRLGASNIKAKAAKVVSSLLLTLMITACGGSSDTTEDNTVTPDPTEEATEETTNTIDDEFGLWLIDIANNHILPSYQSLEGSSTVLSQNAVSFCESDSQTSAAISALQDNWRSVMNNWQTVQWVKVGPAADDNRIFRIHYWPDSKDTVASGLATLLTIDETVTEEYISTRSVGSQGLPALEQLLFSESENSLLNASDKTKRCEILTAISANVATISTEINSAWKIDEGNYYADLTQGTGDFSSKKDAIEELVTNWLEQIEFVKDEKLLVPLAINSPGIPSAVEHELSGGSMLSVQHNIATFKTIYTAGDGHGFDKILIDYLGQQNIATEMLTSIDSAITAADLLTDSDETLLASTEGRANITATIDALRAIRDVLTVDFVQATDINIGFNSNDGD